ncbi:hypothetical protein HOG21_04030 [bacterium]|jgi:hypothetical protein|nr:hypothetical protein [bacterium]
MNPTIEEFLGIMEGADEILDQYTDEELKEMVDNMGIAEAMSHILLNGHLNKENIKDAKYIYLGQLVKIINLTENE